MVYVPDASRSVSVCSELLSPERRGAYLHELQADYRKVRELHASQRRPRPWSRWRRPVPTGSRSALDALCSYRASSGQPRAGELPAGRVGGLHRLGALLPDLGSGRPLPRHPEWTRWWASRARKVFADAQAMLNKLVAGRWLRADGVFALWPAAQVNDDDIAVFNPQGQALMTWHGLRLQSERPVVDGVKRPNRCPSRTSSRRRRTVKPRDHIGLFAVTVHGVEKKEAEFLAQHDDYSANPAQGPGRSPGRGLCRTPAPARAHRVLGLFPRRSAEQRRADP